MAITRDHLDKEWIESAAEYLSSEKRGPFKFIPFPADRLLASPPAKDDWRKCYLYLDNSVGERRGWIVYEEDIDETLHWNSGGTVMMMVGSFASLSTIEHGMWVFVPISIALILVLPGFLYWLFFIRPWQSRIFTSNHFVLLDEDLWHFFHSAHALRQSVASIATTASTVTGAIAGGVMGAVGGPVLGRLTEIAASLTTDAVADPHATKATANAVNEAGDKFLDTAQNKIPPITQ